MTSVLCPPDRRAGRGSLAIDSRQFREDGLLTADQERELAASIATGDADARDRLVRSNLRLVVVIARLYVGPGLEMDDLIGEGNLGLIRAAEDFDPSFNVRFSTYAAYWIKQAIRVALTNTAATIRLPYHIVNLLSKWRRAEKDLARESGEAPAPDEIAAVLGLTASQRAMVGKALLSQHLGHDAADDGPLSRHAAGGDWRPEAEVERSEERRGLQSRMEGRLDGREWAVIALRFGLDDGEPMTLKEVGVRLGVTREWVRKIEKRALGKLQDGEDEAIGTTP